VKEGGKGGRGAFSVRPIGQEEEGEERGKKTLLPQSLNPSMDRSHPGWLLMVLKKGGGGKEGVFAVQKD